MINAFQYLEYKKAIREIALERKKRHGARFNFESLAKACRIQKTYLSRVLNHDGDLSRDQLYRACVHLELSPDERTHLLAVHEAQLTTIQELKTEIVTRLKKERQSRAKTESTIVVNTQTNSSQIEDGAQYHLDPYYPLIHMFLTVREYAQDTSLITRALKISEKKTANVIKGLERMGHIHRLEKSFKVVKDDLHLSQDHPLYPVYRAMMRLKAIEKMNQAGEEGDYSFSAIFSTDDEVRHQIQREFLQFLSKVKNLVSEGEERGIFQINFDLLKWG